VFRAPNGREVDEVVYVAPSGDEASLTANVPGPAGRWRRPSATGAVLSVFAFGLERASGPRPPDDAPPGAEDEGGPPEARVGRRPRAPGARSRSPTWLGGARARGPLRWQARRQSSARRQRTTEAQTQLPAPHPASPPGALGCRHHCPCRVGPRPSCPGRGTGHGTGVGRPRRRGRAIDSGRGRGRPMTPGRPRVTGTGRDAGAHEGLLDYDGAAQYLCTTPRHVRELWAKRYLAAIKVGRSVRFSKVDLDAYIAARRVDAVR
jgi:excisionase family DNA binding protein